MMKTRYWLVLSTILVVINLAWIWRIDKNSQEYNQRIDDTQNRFMQVNRELSLLKRGWDYSMMSDGQKIPADIKVRNQGGNINQLTDYIGLMKKLVLVVSDRHCSTCVDQLLFLIRNEIPAIQRNNILVLYSSGDKNHSQWEYRKKILTGVSFLEMEDFSLGLAMDSLDIPYLFMAGPERLATLSYAPFPSLESQTKDYLKLISIRHLTKP